MKVNILIVDDEKDLCWGVQRALENEGYKAEYVLNGEDALEKVKKKNYHLVILDYKLPGIDGLETLQKIKETSRSTGVIFITAHGDQDLALKSIELGADEYIHKPFNIKNMLFRIYKILKMGLLENQVQEMKGRGRDSFSQVVFTSPEMGRVIEVVDRIARHNSPVLVTGETGTGKGLIASTIHYNTMNPRKDAPFLTINCGAIPEPLMESELFGHSKGAFTGAVAAKTGLFEAAKGGTLFLDELSSAPLSLQTKLLRILDNGEYMRVGETTPRKTDTRIVGATNKDLDVEVAEGRFREDLYHRLRVVQIELPPLRERRQDIKPLADYFLEYFNKQFGKMLEMSDEAFDALMVYEWPGNIRELKHCIESAVLMCEGNIVRSEDLPPQVGGEVKEEAISGDYSEIKSRIIENFEKGFFARVIKEAGGNVSKAARMANLSRTYLIKKLKQYDIDASDV